ncbi:hypothetical protein [Sphingopyxis sp.]|uniref:hypothetical protein n=1 Tax=Sphingopyxis sp. TaxID=1908224 RepID=UPI003D0F1530
MHAPKNRASADVCSASVAHDTTVAAIAAQPAEWLGKCVRVEGLKSGDFIYADRDALYRLPKDSLDVATNGGTLLLDNRKIIDTIAGDWQKVRVVARVRDCVEIGAKQDAASADDMAMLAGGCHYNDTTGLWVAEISSLGESRPQRLLQTEASGLGNIAPLDAGSPWRARFADVERQLLAALQSNDPERRQSLFLTQWMGSEQREWVSQQISGKMSPLAAIMDPRTSVQSQIFGWKANLDDSPADIDAKTRADQADAIICWSAAAKAADLWPVSSFDATLNPDRPYACVKVTYRIDGESNRWQAAMEPDRWSLTEPPHL